MTLRHEMNLRKKGTGSYEWGKWQSAKIERVW